MAQPVQLLLTARPIVAEPLDARLPTGSHLGTPRSDGRDDGACCGDRAADRGNPSKRIAHGLQEMPRGHSVGCLFGIHGFCVTRSSAFHETDISCGRQHAMKAWRNRRSVADRETEVKSSSRRPKLRTKKGMSEPRYPSGKSVEVIVKLKAYRDQAAIVGSAPKPGFEINDQLSDNNQEAVVAVAEVLNQFRHGFTEGGVPEYATAFGEALSDLMAKHWPAT